MNDIENLIKQGADVNAKGDFGTTALHIIARHPDGQDIARLLIENGADIDAKNDFGISVLLNAKVFGECEFSY